MDFYWDAGVARFRRANGQFVAESEVRQFTRQSVEAGFDEVNSLASRVYDGNISVADWQASMREEIKKEYIRQAVVGAGGEAQMDSAAWGSVGGQLQGQYRHLDRFAADVATGELSETQIQHRSRMYIKSARQAYERALWKGKREAGFDLCRWVPNYAAENCPDCVEFANLEWQRIADQPYGGCRPASGCTVCLTNCACTIRYRRSISLI